MSFTFDGPNRLIVCNAGTTGIVLADLWSRFKVWLLADNAGYLPAFDTVGGDPIDAGTRVPLYLFIKNGWRIRPQEATHTLNVTDGILVVDGGGDPFVNPLGAFTVRVRYSQPVQAFGYSTTGTSGPTSAEIAAEVLSTLQAAVIPVPVNAVQMAGAVIVGDGSEANMWRGTGVSP